MPAPRGPGLHDGHWLPHDPDDAVPELDYDLDESLPDDGYDDFPWPDERYEDYERH